MQLLSFGQTHAISQKRVSDAKKKLRMKIQGETNPYDTGIQQSPAFGWHHGVSTPNLSIQCRPTKGPDHEGQQKTWCHGEAFEAQLSYLQSKHPVQPVPCATYNNALVCIHCSCDFTNTRWDSWEGYSYTWERKIFTHWSAIKYIRHDQYEVLWTFLKANGHLNGVAKYNFIIFSKVPGFNKINLVRNHLKEKQLLSKTWPQQS